MRLGNNTMGWHSGAGGRNAAVHGKIASSNSSDVANSLLALRLQLWRSAHRPGKIVDNTRCFCHLCFRGSISEIVEDFAEWLPFIQTCRQPQS